MLVLVTGNPGSGKTLWTLKEVRAESAKGMPGDPSTARPVFYNGIPELKLEGWTELTDEQARDPHSLPAGSLIVCDEVYRLWPAPRKAGSDYPEYVEKFATHRHRGHDFYLICQKPSQLHHFIRDLVGRHIHFERQYGLPRARKFEWQRLGDVGDRGDRALAAGSEFIYPKEVYSWYKSSDMHTVKQRLPWIRLGLMAAGAVLAAFLSWRVFDNFSKQGKPHEKAKAVAAGSGEGVAQNGPNKYEKSQGLTKERWIQRERERWPGLPYSSPLFDAVYVAKTFPKVSGCMELKTSVRVHCICNSQQGTILTTVSVAQCEFWLVNGWFDPSRPDKQEGGAGYDGFSTTPAQPPTAITPPSTPVASIGGP